MRYGAKGEIMGWSFSFKNTKAEEVQKIVSGFNKGYTTLDHRVVGNNLWVLLETPKHTRTIVLYLLQAGSKKHGEGWGHKGLDENMGPCEVDCPLSLLNRTTAPEAGYAKDWREKVRQHHANRAARPEPVAGMVLAYGGQNYRLSSPVGPRKGWNVTRISDGVDFRMKAHQISEALERAAEPAPVIVQPEQPQAEPVQLDFFQATQAALC